MLKKKSKRNPKTKDNNRFLKEVKKRKMRTQEREELIRYRENFDEENSEMQFDEDEDI